MLFEIDKDFKLNVKGTFDELDKEDAIKEFEHLIDPLLDEFQEKLNDRFTSMLSGGKMEVTDLEQENFDRIESIKEEIYFEN